MNTIEHTYFTHWNVCLKSNIIGDLLVSCLWWKGKHGVIVEKKIVSKIWWRTGERYMAKCTKDVPMLPIGRWQKKMGGEIPVEIFQKKKRLIGRYDLEQYSMMHYFQCPENPLYIHFCYPTQPVATPDLFFIGFLLLSFMGGNRVGILLYYLAIVDCLALIVISF